MGKIVMADKVNFKMLFYVFIVFLIVNGSFSLANEENMKPCNCYDVCSKNFTKNFERDLKKISACERGCRLYTLLLHVSPKENSSKNATNVLQACSSTCTQAYIYQDELQACNDGCDFNKNLEYFCKPLSLEPAKIAYTLFIKDSDSIFNTDPDPDDPLNDPSLRKQIQRTLHQIFNIAQKIPETHFRNYPVVEEKPIDTFIRANYKCPKFYGLDSKLEFRNGRIIIGDLYLFVGVFLFVIVCFILGHHFETRNMARQMMDYRTIKKDDLDDGEPLLKVQINEDGEPVTIPKEDLSEYPIKTEVLDANFESITLVFREELPIKGIKENPKI